jgi:hypothetical protein
MKLLFTRDSTAAAKWAIKYLGLGQFRSGHKHLPHLLYEDT